MIHRTRTEHKVLMAMVEPGRGDLAQGLFKMRASVYVWKNPVPEALHMAAEEIAEIHQGFRPAYDHRLDGID
jgi:hypothetical protein